MENEKNEKESKNIIKEKVENVVNEVKEKLDETKEKATEVINEVKEKAEIVKEKATEVIGDVKEKLEVAKEKTEKIEKIIETTTSKTWWNRIWSAIVGAVVAIGAMFGITSGQIDEQKERVDEVKKLAADALTSIKNGKLDDAKASLEKAAVGTKEIINESKEVISNIKEADKEEVKETFKDSFKEEMKKPAKE